MKIGYLNSKIQLLITLNCLAISIALGRIRIRRLGMFISTPETKMADWQIWPFSTIPNFGANFHNCCMRNRRTDVVTVNCSIFANLFVAKLTFFLEKEIRKLHLLLSISSGSITALLKWCSASETMGYFLYENSTTKSSEPFSLSLQVV